MARRPRELSAEEQALWSSVASTTVPLENRQPLKPEAKPTKKKTSVRRPKQQPMPEFRIGEALDGPNGTGFSPRPDIADEVANAPVAMDRKAFRKLARGKLKPEARIDLHGRTLAQAQPVLTSFILGSQAAGLRLVLVITGKGRTDRDTGGPIPERKGILRDQVPRWLGQGPLKSAVLQVAQAHVSHGGGGAYYVYLRRPR